MINLKLTENEANYLITLLEQNVQCTYIGYDNQLKEMQCGLTKVCKETDYDICMYLVNKLEEALDERQNECCQKI